MNIEKLRNKEIYFKASSLLQLVSFTALIKLLRDEDEHSNAYIFYQSYWNKSLALDTNLAFSELNITLIDDLDLYKERLKTKNPIVICKVNNSYQPLFSNSTVVVIDDGTGAYRTNPIRLYQASKREKKMLEKKSDKNMVTFILKFYIKKSKSFLLPPIYFSMFSRSLPFKAKPNEHFLENLKKILPFFTNKKVSTIKTPFEKYFIFATSPLASLGIINAEKYHLFLKVLVDNIKKTHKAHILIKPHPADNFSYHGFDVLDSEIFIEAFMDKNRDRIQGLIGFYSTSQLTASLALNIPSYNLRSSIFDEYEKEIDRSILYIFKKHTIPMAIPINIEQA